MVGAVVHPMGPLVSGGRRWMHTPVGNAPELPASGFGAMHLPWSHSFLHSEGWIPCSCSCFSIQRYNTGCQQLQLGLSMTGPFVTFTQSMPRYKGFRASRMPTDLLQRGYEQVTHSSALSWPSTGHQISCVSLKSLIVCPQCT